ncbi:nitrite reductase [Lysinibacillus xylanilyticus]|uniref:nitrite reductase n=1 Tax=Lysinibacillus xylanilyticus TaxID=582475 RepID=UPI0037FDFB62
MKRFLLNWLGLAAIRLIGVAISIVTSTNVFMPDTCLDSRKIERNIKKLRLFSWFNELYEDDRHHSSFFINKHVRKYLESSIRVYLLKSSEKEQMKFIHLLEKVAQERGENKVKKTTS